MKKDVADVLSLPVDVVEAMLEEGELIAYTVEVLHVYQHDELVAQRIGIMVGNEQEPPATNSSVERILRRTTDTLEEARLRNRDDAPPGVAEVRQERRSIQ